jgi:hypothetical protein
MRKLQALGSKDRRANVVKTMTDHSHTRGKLPGKRTLEAVLDTISTT